MEKVFTSIESILWEYNNIQVLPRGHHLLELFFIDLQIGEHDLLSLMHRYRLEAVLRCVLQHCSSVKSVVISQLCRNHFRKLCLHTQCLLHLTLPKQMRGQMPQRCRVASWLCQGVCLLVVFVRVWKKWLGIEPFSALPRCFLIGSRPPIGYFIWKSVNRKISLFSNNIPYLWTITNKNWEGAGGGGKSKWRTLTLNQSSIR